MGVNIPTEDVALPEAISKAVERAKNAVTEHDAEAKRLRELALSSQYEVDELRKAKVDLTERVSELEASVSELKAEEASLKSSIEEQRAAFEKERAEMDSARKQRDFRETKLLNHELEVTERDAAIDKREAELRRAEGIVAAGMAELKGKTEKIKDFAATL